MTFSEKLDVLMSITGTSNSALGRALSYDASYISRVRSGKRGLPRRQPFLAPASALFARAILSPVQRNAAASLLTPGRAWPEDPEQGAAILLRWLSSAPEDMNEPIDQFFQSLTAAPRAPQSRPNAPLPPEADAADPAFYYGNRGKREAVYRFLADLCADGQPHDLHLVSDESMTWLTEDPSFARQWSALLETLLAQGGTITIIHTIDRSLGEMLGGLRQWIPLYLTGGILPYYCPQLRDGILRRSLFVSPGRGALAANSIADRTEGMINLYTRRPEAAAAYETEFQNYLALCRPLMDIYTANRTQALLPRLEAMIRSSGPLFSVSSVPLPLALDLKGYEPLRRAMLDRLDGGGELVEFLHLPDPGTVTEGTVPLPLSDFLSTPQQIYPPSLLRAQAADALARSKTNPNYHVILSHTFPKTVTLLARSREEVLVLPSAPPTTAFSITEPRMASALWDYLQRAADTAARKNAVSELSQWIQALDRLSEADEA